MTKRTFIADLHTGHESIIRFDNRPYWTIEEMNDDLMRSWNETVGENYTVHILGDLCWGNVEVSSDFVCQLNGEKHLILGNHDVKSENYFKLFNSVKEYDKIL